MKLRNRLFLVFFPVAFLPVAILSYLGLELATDGVDRIASPGIERALTNAGSLVEMTHAEFEEYALESVQSLPPNSTAEDFTSMGLDFAVVIDQSDTSASGLDDDSNVSDYLVEFPQTEDSVPISGIRTVDDRLMIYAAVRDGPKSVVAGYLLDKAHRTLYDELGSDLQQFDRLKLLKSSGKKFLQLIWLGGNLIYLLLILVVANVTARGLTKPLSQLEHVVEKVGPDNWNLRIDHIRNDEIGTLAAGFNRMSTRLSETTQRLVETERVAAWQQTARVIAHGIKNILAPVKLAMARLSKSASQSDADLLSPIETIQLELDLLERTARDFSIYGRPVIIGKNKIDLNSSIRRAVSLCETESNSPTISVDLYDRLPLIRGDDAMLTEAIVNLIRNGCEAAGPAGSVTVASSHTDGRSEVIVSDNGSGVDPKLGDSVFEPYVTSKATGTGLGLAIAKKIVETCGGVIGYDTGADGTTFIASFRANNGERSS